jgi:hypothetical protein
MAQGRGESFKNCDLAPVQSLKPKPSSAISDTPMPGYRRVLSSEVFTALDGNSLPRTNAERLYFILLCHSTHGRPKPLLDFAYQQRLAIFGAKNTANIMRREWR